MPDPQPPKPPDTGNVDPLLESLMAKARPIIAEERGLNHRSRVKIQSLGKKMKIPAAVIDQALQLLHGAPPVHGSGREETHYEKAFAKSMARKIAELPGRILTSKIEEKAISIGTGKYQLSEIQARNIVRRVAEEAGVPRVTLTEAERHMEQEIADLIGEETWITGEKKIRLIRNGKRLGVTQEQTESMIQRYLQFNFKQVQFERKLTDRLWVVAACIVVGTGVSLFVFFQLQKAQKETREHQQANEKKQEKLKEKKEDTEVDSGSHSWWDDELNLALQKTRLKVGGFPEIHDRLRNKSAQVRANAYRDLFKLGEGKVNPRVIRERVRQVMPDLFLTEPSAEAVAGFLKGFENTIKMPAGKIPATTSFFTKAFWALDLLNEIIGREELSDEKVVAVQGMIESVTGRKFDLFLSQDPRGQKQKRALIESYFKQLADLADAYPSLAPDLFEKLEELVSDDLSIEKLQEFRLIFLKSYLTADESRWANCSRMLKTAVLESTGSQMEYFIAAMESTGNEPLQIFLEEALVQRSGVGEDAETVEELAIRLREYFELDSPSDVEEETSRLAKIDQLLNDFYSRWLIEPAEPNNRRVAELMVETTYLATIVAMVDSPETDTLDRLLDLGFPKLNDVSYFKKLSTDSADLDDEAGKPGDKATGEVASQKSDADDRQTRQDMQAVMAQLKQFKRLVPPRRVSIFKLAEQIAPFLKQIDGAEATVLAEYLLTRKPEEEKSIIQRALPKFRHLPRLQIAIADVLQEGTWPKQTSLDVASQLLNEDLRIAGQDWQLKLADYLRQVAQNTISERIAISKSESVDAIQTLKGIVETLYRIRVQAIGFGDARMPESSDLDNSLDFLIDYYQGLLVAKKDLNTLNHLRQRKDMALVLGKDPLSRFQLKQKAILGAMGTSPSPAPGKAAEINRKLNLLCETRIRKIPSIVGQIAENEIQLLLKYYQGKLK